MEQRKLGIIGGMGPMATSVFFEKIIENTVSNSDQEHIDTIIINHATLPDRTTVIQEGRGEEFLREIRRDFDLLEKAEVSYIAIPCNTSHHFYDDMQKMTSIPIIHMVHETVKEIHQFFGEGCKVGLLATNGTVKTGIYEKECNKFNIHLYTPEDELQNKVMNIIYSFKSNVGSPNKDLEELVSHLVDNVGCQCVILACTELSCIPLDDKLSSYTVDAMGILVEKSIENVGKKVRQKELSKTYV